MSTAKCSMEIAPSNFQGSIAVHRTHLKAVCSSSCLTLSPDNPIPGSSKLLKRKENSSQNYDRCLGVRLRYRHASAPWFRKLHLIPFRITVPHPPREMDLHRFTGFHHFLRTDSLSTDCRSRETFLHVDPQGFHLSICYYHQDLHQWLLHPSSRKGFDA